MTTVEDRRRYNGENNRSKTHCPQGHPLAGDNLLPSKLKIGKRECRLCHNQRSRIYKQRRREAQRDN